MLCVRQGLAFGLLLLALIAGSPTRHVGDGGEYAAIALNLSALRAPSLSGNDIEEIDSYLKRYEEGFQDVDLQAAGHEGADGRSDFVHFWFYPALAAPGVAVARFFGFSVLTPFTILNCLLLVLAFFVICRGAGWAAALLLCASPVLWWIDKAHTEVFTFTMLTLAFGCLSQAPWWSTLALGAASTQNPPIGLLIPLVVWLACFRTTRGWQDRRIWLGAAAGVALAALHPLYFFTRLGRLSALISPTELRVPSIAQAGAVVWDPNLGLLAASPFLFPVVVAVLLTLARRGQLRHAWNELAVSGAALALFLFSFAQTDNVNHGGTPGMSRYAIWLIPLAVPVLRQGRVACSEVLKRWLPATALVACVWSLFMFHPQHPERSGRPSALAAWQWADYPSWNDPLPEVFVERLGGGSSEWLPVATPGCEKVLFLGRGDVGGGMWPIPCFPAEIPAACREPGMACYANRRGDGYEFSAPFAQGRFDYLREVVWKRASEPMIRRVLAEYEWWTLRPMSREDMSWLLEDRRGIGAVFVWHGTVGRALVLADVGPVARLTLRIEGRRTITATFVDPETGHIVGQYQSSEADLPMWRLPVRIPTTYSCCYYGSGNAFPIWKGPRTLGPFLLLPKITPPVLLRVSRLPRTEWRHLGHVPLGETRWPAFSRRVRLAPQELVAAVLDSVVVVLVDPAIFPIGDVPDRYHTVDVDVLLSRVGRYEEKHLRIGQCDRPGRKADYRYVIGRWCKNLSQRSGRRPWLAISQRQESREGNASPRTR